MFSKIFNWVKTHKLLTVTIIVLLFIFLFHINQQTLKLNEITEENYNSGVSRVSNDATVYPKNLGLSYEMESLYTPSDYPSTEAGSENRKVVTNSSLSLLVKNVDATVENINQKTLEMGGYMVNTNIQRDEEADSATIEVRIPSDKLDEFSKYLRSESVKVVYENIVGTDITEQYTDYQEQLQSLESVKERLQEIMDEAVTVDEILNVQNRIFSIQRQIDSTKGQIAYMDNASSTSKVTITISTDELSLPYTPVKSWRPNVILKNAIRSLILISMGIGTVILWAFVFAPLVILFFALKITVDYLTKQYRLRKKDSIRNLK